MFVRITVTSCNKRDKKRKIKYLKRLSRSMHMLKPLMGIGNYTPNECLQRILSMQEWIIKLKIKIYEASENKYKTNSYKLQFFIYW